MTVRIPLVAATLAALVLLPSCAQMASNQLDEAPLAGTRIGGPFSLVNQDGQPVTDQSFAGRYRLVYFGFANCPDVCPTDLALVGQALRQFESAHPAEATRVVPIFITVDPARDTPAVLKRYVASFHPRMVGLTGTQAQIDAVVRAYAAYASRDTPNAQGAYNVNHSRQILLMSPDNQPIAALTHDQGADGIAAELARWVR